MKTRALAAASMVAALLAGCGPAEPPAPPPVPVFSAQSGFARFTNEFVEARAVTHPVDATPAGVRAQDQRPPSVSPGELEQRAVVVRAWLTRLLAISPRTLEAADRLDYRLIEHALRADLLDLEERTAGDFRLGSDLLQRTLLYRHHLDIPVTELYALNRQAIDEYREWMGRVAMTVDPLRRPEVLIDSLTAAVRGGSDLIPPGISASPVAPEGSPARSPVRALLAPTALGESWLHYVDQAALVDPAVDDIERLAGIRRALHSHALLHAMLTLHSGEATLEEAARDFASIAMVDADVAERETRRVAIDPGAAIPAIGRMQIFALRDQLRAERRGALDEEAFDRELIALGLPIPLAAEAMLGYEPRGLLVVGERTPGLPPLPGPLER